MDSEDMLNEQKKVKMIKFGTSTRGVLIPKTMREFLGLNDDEDINVASYQRSDGTRYIAVSCVNGQE